MSSSTSRTNRRIVLASRPKGNVTTANFRLEEVPVPSLALGEFLVRNLYLSRDKTLQRKVVEACLAIKLARAWSRDRILTAYLNDVYYGNHAYGIEAAAETYFSVPASRLTLAQAALLAGLPQAPSYYDPLHNPAAALARREHDLERVAERYAAALEEAAGGPAVVDTVLREVSEAAADVGIAPATRESSELAERLAEVDLAP